MVLFSLTTISFSFMPNIVDSIVGSLPDFISTSRTACRTYREFESYPQQDQDMQTWLNLALKVQKKVKDQELDSVVAELKQVIRAKV